MVQLPQKLILPCDLHFLQVLKAALVESSPQPAYRHLRLSGWSPTALFRYGKRLVHAPAAREHLCDLVLGRVVCLFGEYPLANREVEVLRSSPVERCAVVCLPWEARTCKSDLFAVGADPGCRLGVDGLLPTTETRVMEARKLRSVALTKPEVLFRLPIATICFPERVVPDRWLHLLLCSLLLCLHLSS